MVSADDGWSVGYDAAAGGVAFTLHEHAGVWTMQPLPPIVSDPGLSFSPLGVQMISLTDGWLYGSIGQNFTLPSRGVILHLVAGVWREEALPPGLSAIHAISFVSADMGWALGYPADLTSNDTVVLRYHSGAWTIEKTIANVRLSTLSMSAPSDGMAAGSHGLYRYKAGLWAPVTLPASIPMGSWEGIAMVSATEAWALAFYTPPTQCQECGSGIEAVLAHFMNGTWTQVKGALTFPLERLHTFDSDAETLPNPLYATADGQVWISYGMLAHYASGKQITGLATGCASDFWAASPVPGTDEAWAIGSNGQLFHYVAGKISRYESGAPCS
jgi:hypothetical protein